MSCVSTEPLLCPEENRLSILPIRYPDIWYWFETAHAAQWVAGEVDLSRDPHDWKTKLTEDERRFLLVVLSFFAASDGVVNDNLAERFVVDVQIREVKFFYDLQKHMENVHNQMYGLLIETLVDEPSERMKLLNGVAHMKCVKNKVAWAQKWITSNESFASRLVAFSVVEGVFFSASFAAVFFFKKRGLLPGLCVSNTLISRDEAMHQEFATFLYRDYIKHKLSDAEVHSIVSEAVAIESEFVAEALQRDLVGMNKRDMTEYVRFVADRLLTELGAPKLYHASMPFDWMSLISLENKTNMFEQRVSEYTKVGAREGSANHTFTLTDASW